MCHVINTYQHTVRICVCHTHRWCIHLCVSHCVFSGVCYMAYPHVRHDSHMMWLLMQFYRLGDNSLKVESVIWRCLVEFVTLWRLVKSLRCVDNSLSSWCLIESVIWRCLVEFVTLWRLVQSLCCVDNSLNTCIEFEICTWLIEFVMTHWVRDM